MTYDEFKTGLRYEDVWRMLWSGDPDPSRWPHKNVGAVLRFWGGLKRAMWEEFYANGIDPETLPPPPKRKRPARTKPKVCRPLLAPVARPAPPPGHEPSWTRGGKQPKALRQSWAAA